MLLFFAHIQWMMVAGQQHHSIGVWQARLSPFFDKKAWAACTKGSHQMYAAQAVHGAFTSYCRLKTPYQVPHLLIFEIDENCSNLSLSLYTSSYNSIKTWIQKGNSATPLGPTMHMIAAAEAGILTLVMTNPIWVVKTRLCLQYGHDIKSAETRYNGMIDALAKIYRQEGVRGLYRVRKRFEWQKIRIIFHLTWKWLNSSDIFHFVAIE